MRQELLLFLKGPRSVLSANAMIATNGCDIWSVCRREHKPVSCAGACRPSFDGRRRSSAVWLREAATQSTQEAWGDGSLFVGYTYSSVADSYETELGTFVSVVIKCWGETGVHVNLSVWMKCIALLFLSGYGKVSLSSTSDLLNSNHRTVRLDWKAYPKEMQRSTYSSIGSCHRSTARSEGRRKKSGVSANQ